MDVYCTEVWLNVPTPWGAYPFLTYCDGGVPVFTFILVLIGIGMSTVTVMLIEEGWRDAFFAFAMVNLFFVVIPIGGAGSCEDGGCDQASAFFVAGMWYLPIFALFLALFLFRGFRKLVETIYHFVRR